LALSVARLPHYNGAAIARLLWRTANEWGGGVAVACAARLVRFGE
jgi:hypothetical protein